MPTGSVAAVNVKGLKELNRALKLADRETREGIQHAFRQVAVPVKLEAQRLAVTEISGLRRTNLKTGGEWGLMRIGITQKLVYVAPFKHGKKKGSQKRKNFAGILMDKAMQPALDKNVTKIEAAAEEVLDHMADNFNRNTMTDTPRFVINGTEYPIPQIDSFTIDECGVFHEWTNVHVEEIEELPVNSMMIAAFMQIAYMRGNPGMVPAVARRMVGQSNLVEAMSVFALDQEEDARPPELPKSEPEQSGSPESSEYSPSTSGIGSTTRSDTRVSDQTSGGTPPSGIHVTSGQLRSVG